MIKTRKRSRDTAQVPNAHRKLKTGPANSFGFPNSIALQPKLSIGKSGDKYEKEADRTADAVMAKPGPVGQAEQKKPTISPKAVAATPNVASPSLEQKIKSSKGAGHPLPENTRSFMESRFGSDFRAVKIHTGSKANLLNRELNAGAATFDWTLS